jgi:putative transposase
MTSKRAEPEPLPTIWRVPDDLWARIAPILAAYDPPKRTGRRRINERAALDAIIFRMRTGCQWNRLSKTDFPNDRSVHRAFQRWVRLGIFERIWAALVADCEELDGVDWAWQAADTSMAKARFGGI